MAAIRKRRLVIGFAAAGLLIGLAAASFVRPQVDPRYVGTWTIQLPSEQRTWPLTMIEFRPDGAATWWSSDIPENRTYAPSPLRWRSSGNWLIWRRENESPGAAIWRAYELLRYRCWKHNAAAPQENVLEVIAVTENEIEADYVAPSQARVRCILRRAE